MLWVFQLLTLLPSQPSPPVVQCVCLVPNVAKVTKTNQMNFRKRFRDPLEREVIGKHSFTGAPNSFCQRQSILKSSCLGTVEDTLDCVLAVLKEKYSLCVE